MEHLYRKSVGIPRDKYRPHRTSRRAHDDDDSSGFSSSDYSDAIPRISRGSKSLRFVGSNPSKGHNIDDVQSSLSTINSDLARILALLQSQALQRTAQSAVYSNPEQPVFSQTTRPSTSGYITAPIEHAQTRLASRRRPVLSQERSCQRGRPEGKKLFSIWTNTVTLVLKVDGSIKTSKRFINITARRPNVWPLIMYSHISMSALHPITTMFTL